MTPLCEYIREDCWECTQRAEWFVMNPDPKDGFKQSCDNHAARLHMAHPDQLIMVNV